MLLRECSESGNGEGKGTGLGRRSWDAVLWKSSAACKGGLGWLFKVVLSWSKGDRPFYTYTDRSLGVVSPWKEADWTSPEAILKDEGQLEVTFWQPSQLWGEKRPLSWTWMWGAYHLTYHALWWLLNLPGFCRSMDYKLLNKKKQYLFVPKNSLCKIFLDKRDKSSCFPRMSKKWLLSYFDTQGFLEHIWKPTRWIGVTLDWSSESAENL